MRLTPGLVTNNWELKITALGLALLLWAAVRSETTTRYTIKNVPVRVRLVDDEWVRIAPPAPQQVSVDVTGPVRELVRLAFHDQTLVVPVEDVDDTLEVMRVQTPWIDLGGRFESVRVEDVTPASVRLFFQPIETRMVPVRVTTTSLPAGYRLVGEPRSQPARVQIRGARNRVQAIDSIGVTLKNADRAREGGMIVVPIDTTRLGVEVAPLEVQVSLPLEPLTAPADSARGDSAAARRRSAARP